MHRFGFLLPAFVFLFAACAQPEPETPPDVPETADMADVAVRFVTPSDGDTVDATFAVGMHVEGARLAAAGTMEPGTGHFHILIDTTFVPAGQVIPNNEHHRHFGDASTETELTLEPGEHVLRLQFADGAHMALEGEQYRDTVRIFVR